MQIQPGLGLSETWYSWIVSVQSLGELIGAIAAGIVLRWFYTKYLMLSALTFSGCGGLLFGIGRHGWMLLIGIYIFIHIWYTVNQTRGSSSRGSYCDI